MKKTTSKTVCANPEAWRLGFGEGRSRDIMLPFHKSEMQSSKPLYRQQDPGVIELGDLQQERGCPSGRFGRKGDRAIYITL